MIFPLCFSELSPQAAHELLVKRIQHLPDREVSELSHRVKVCGKHQLDQAFSSLISLFLSFFLLPVCVSFGRSGSRYSVHRML